MNLRAQSFLICCAIGSSAYAAQYNIVEFPMHHPSAVNASAVVAGYSGLNLAQMFQEGIVTSLGTLPGSSQSIARGINDLGDIVGNTSGGASHAFIYRAGSMSDLGVFPGDGTSIAHDINNSGQIVGSSAKPSVSERAVLYQGGTITDLGTLPGLPFAEAFAINELGDIVGYCHSGPTSLGFVYSDGVLTALPTLGGPHTNAHDINDAGAIVGSSFISELSERAYVLENGVMTNLGTLGENFSRAYAINNLGQIVGYSRHADQSLRAFLYREGVMYDLNDLTNSEVQLVAATDINERGQIVGTLSNGNSFLLTPVPEPGALSISLTTLLAAYAEARRRSRRSAWRPV